jgi:hypothetical protein
MSGRNQAVGRRTRRTTVLATALAMTVCSWTGAQVVTGQPAHAVTPPVAMTADALPTWQTNGIVWTSAQSGGTVFIGGTFSAIRPPGSAAGTEERNALNFASFDAATGEPADCQLDFTIGSGVAKVDALQMSPDGKILYAGGSFGTVNGVGVSNLAAIDVATCEVLTSFRPVVTAPIHALAVTDDRVYIAGDFHTVEGENRERFAAVTTDGELLPWNPRTDEPGRAVEVLPGGGRVAIGGDFFTVRGTASHALAVVNTTNGDLVRAYPGFIESRSVVKDITSDSTGFYVADEGTGGGVFDGRIAMDLDTLTQRWRDTCLGATQALEVYKGVLYSASHAHDCSSMGEFPDGERRHLLAEPVNDPKLLGWLPDTDDGDFGEQIGPRTIVTSSAGGKDYMWVGGNFMHVNGGAQQSLTRFAESPDTGRPSVPQAGAVSTEPGKVEFRWRAATDEDDSDLTYRVYRDGNYSTPVYTVSGSSSPWLRPQFTYTDTDVAPGEEHSYRVTASDGSNTSGLSATVRATPAAKADAYAAKVVSDGAALYWRFDSAGSFAADSSGQDNNGVHMGGPTLGVTPGAVPGSSEAVGYAGKSYQFTHSEKAVQRPTNLSIETWFKTTTRSGGKLVGAENKYQLTSTNYDRHIYLTNSGRLVFGAHSDGVHTVSTDGAYNDGRWHHVVATLGSNGMRLYVDGRLRATGSARTGENYADYWRVGGGNLKGWPSRPSNDYFQGQIDETAIYPTVLSSSQVADHYELGSS